MKQIAFIFLFVFYSQLTLQAQNVSNPWIVNGATWFYTWSAIGWGGNDKIVYEGDTVVQGINCQKLVTYRDIYGLAGPGGPIILIDKDTFPPEITYNNGDTVFWYYGNEFHPIYNFGALSGDRLNMGIDTNLFYCGNSVLNFYFDSTMNINGKIHRVNYSADSINSSMGVYGQNIEHIGNMNYLFPLYRNCDTTSIVEFFMFDFSCFQDDSVSYLVVDPEECENPYHVGLFEFVRGDNFTVYPNPAINELILSFDDFDEKHISIYNCNGQMIYEDTIWEEILTINLNNKSPGIYLIQYQDEKGKRSVKKFIKE